MSGKDLKDNLADTKTASFNAVEAEKAVLSLCMRNKEALDSSVMRRLVAGDFVDSRHAVIFDAISKIYIDGNEVNRFSVCDTLQSNGKSAEAGGDEYVYDIANYRSVMSALDTYIGVVVNNCQSRKLIKALKESLDMATGHTSSVNDIVDISVNQLNLLKIEDDTTGFENVGVIFRRNLEELRETSFGKGERKVVKTGFPYLDSITGGFKPGTLNIVAARPGMGKTAFVLNVAANVAEQYHKTVAIFSLEMSKSEICNRLLASKSNTDYKAIERGNITREQEADIIQTLGRISDLPIYIDEKTATTPSDVMSKCKELSTRINIDLIIIDYLQLMTVPGKNNGSRQNEIAEISRTLKVIAKELKVPVIALSQLNRGTENREDGDHIPGLADIRDSGAIEQDADCVIFIHRPSYYTRKKEASEKPRIEDAQLIVAKNRHGQTDTAYVKWMGEKTLFFEAPRKGDPEDPQASSYTRTTTQDRSSSDYHFDNDTDAPYPVPEDDVPEQNDGYEDDAFMDSSENDEFFSGDVHNDLPEDMY